MDPRTDELANAINFLLGDAEERFPYERDLRTFQFQCWLLDSRRDEVSFRLSARIFATAVLSTTISRTRARNRSLSVTECFLVAVAHEPTRRLLNSCFGGHYSLYSLLTMDSFPLLRHEHDRALEEIADLNDLVDARVRLHLAGEPSGLNAGLQLLPTLKRASRRRTGLSAVHRKRSMREPFLFAAKCVAPEFLTMEFESTGGKSTVITPDRLQSQVTKKAENLDAFRKLCGAARAIASVIKVEWSAEVKNALGVLEAEMPAVEPISAEFLLKARIPRRSARETRKTVRQRVGI